MRFKLFILSAITVSFISTGFSQPYKYIYYFDKDLNSCRQPNAVVTGKGYKDNGLFKVDFFSNVNGNLLMSIHYTDSTLNTFQGFFQSYHLNAVLEKEGNYENGEMQGLWQQWNDKGLKTDSSIYEKDNKIRFAKFTYDEKEKTMRSYAFTDSLANTFTELCFYNQGKLSSEVVFAGQRGLLKTYDSTGSVKADSVYSREEIEAQFPGGQLGWINFLKKNLNSEVPSDHGAREGSYTVVVKFVINKDGTLTNIEAETNNGYGVENEAIRIIQISPKWIPAKQYGHLVKAYRRQPITFLVQSR